MNGETIRTITIRGQSEGLDKLTADVNKLAAAQENVAIVSEQSAKRVLSLEDAWKRQTMRLDEGARAQANIARETKVADAALREGLATQAQHAQRLEQINQRYAKTADATKIVTQQTGLARHELVNLGRQAQDVGVSLMSGQSPFTVLVQQGTQIADVFATSGGTIRGFFSQAAGWAKTFFTSTTGIVTGVLAIGAAAIYAASQFRTASTTIEQALEEQNRLLKEAKTLIDAKTSAEQRAFAQSKELTQFQLERSQRDIEGKLRSAQESAAIAARGRSTRPTQVGGEMGEAPTGVQSLGPGYEAIADAAQKLNNAMAAGLPGLAAFQEELAKVGRAYPEIAQTAEEMIKLAQTGIPLEQAQLKLRAISDALKGIATDAQLAAVGLGSIAQHQVNTAMAEQAAAATERQAQYTLQIAASYPGMSIEVAKQLDTLQGQLTVAQARTGAEKIAAQEYVTINQLLGQGKTLEEATAIAAGQRAIAEANITNAFLDQLTAAQGLLSVAQARTGAAKMAAQEQVTIAQLLGQGLSLEQATVIAATQRAAAEASVTNAVLDQVDALKDQVELSKARMRGNEAEVKAEQAYNKALRDGASEYAASALKAATLENETQQAAEAASRGAGSMGSWAKSAGEAAASMAEIIDMRLDMLGPSQFKEGGYEISYDPLNTSTQKKSLEQQYGAQNIESYTIGVGLSQQTLWRVKPEYIENLFKELNASLNDVGNMDVSSPEAIQQSFSAVLARGFKDGLTDVNRLLAVVTDPTQQASLIQQTIDRIRATETPSLAREEMIVTLNSKLEQLANSTDSLNSTMQNALSPFYSQDPRTTKLGFRAGAVANPDWMTGATNANPVVAVLGSGATAPGMANGGSFVVGGGYSANDNRMAMFPVASGEEVVVNRTPQGRGGQVINIDNRIVIMGAVDDDALSKMKVSRYQQAQRMRAGLRA